MRIDPPDVIIHTFALTPLRAVFVWCLAGLGASIPIAASLMPHVFELFPGMLTFPFYALPLAVVTALAQEWWAALALPLLAILLYKMWRFTLNDNPPSDLIQIPTLACLIAFSPIFLPLFPQAIAATLLILASVFFAHRDPPKTAW